MLQKGLVGETGKGSWKQSKEGEPSTEHVLWPTKICLFVQLAMTFLQFFQNCLIFNYSIGI